MFFEKIHTEGLAHFSYIFGDGDQAVVIDPRLDCAIYLDIAHREGVRITHIFETHRNEDFVIGSLELSERTGAVIYHGKGLSFEYGETVEDGDVFSFGSLSLRVISTPGHTFESLSFALVDHEFGSEPVAVFSGDTLFIGDVGRTDFFPDRKEEVAGLLHDSIFDKLLPLGDHVLLCPAHGSGSVCGSKMASREFSTLGYERRYNPALQVEDRDEFIRRKVDERHVYPHYFKMMEDANRKGPPLLGRLPRPVPFAADNLAESRDDGLLVLDTREPEAVAGAHIPGSLAIPLDMLAGYGGWFLPYDRDIGLVLPRAADRDRAVRQLVRLGYRRLICHLRGGLHEWEMSGRDFCRIPAVYAGELKSRIDDRENFVLLDVRTPGEWEQGVLEGAATIFLGELPERLDELPRHRLITTFCGSGRRAIIAASILRGKGFERVEVCLGSMAACRKLGCEIRRPSPA